ncbi:hypothetical protein LOK49_LG05G01977 [Camellia lanceoleosa]|uniref:Uncharacterized protein n=1 Tax=Camellia lanceoleosa TaxID=1840588 RepID=A0ACC0HJ84_9ERIC|nr:hypothetical protein LOK49_LG05G01977 [Camellia lanceoleosa]
MVSNVEAAKSDLEVGQKQREGFMYKIKLDNAASELADFREWFDYLSHKCCETNDTCSEMLALYSLCRIKTWVLGERPRCAVGNLQIRALWW